MTDFKIPPGVSDLEARAQIDWEHRLVERGISRYRASLVKEKEDGGLERKSLVDTEPGQVIARDLIGPMIARIELEQVATVQRMEDPDYKRLAHYDWVIVTLPADRLAAVTILRVLGYTEDVPFTQAAKAVARAVQDEFDFDRWKQAESAAEKDRKARGVTEYVPNMFKLMRDRNKVIDQRVFKKWRNKASLYTKSDWDTNILASVGSWLLACLIECNGWYEAVNVREDGLTKRVLRLTDVGRAFIKDRHARNELARPYYLPMIAEPLDYQYKDQGQAASTAT